MGGTQPVGTESQGPLTRRGASRRATLSREGRGIGALASRHRGDPDATSLVDGSFVAGLSHRRDCADPVTAARARRLRAFAHPAHAPARRA